jgi:hypothetical protein
MKPTWLLALGFLLAAVPSAADDASDPAGVRPQSCAEACAVGCIPGQPCYTLVLKFTVNEARDGQAPALVTRETFTGENYPSLDAAYCGARTIRREGYVLPTGQYPVEGNVMPDIVTPMRVI